DGDTTADGAGAEGSVEGLAGGVGGEAQWATASLPPPGSTPPRREAPPRSPPSTSLTSASPPAPSGSRP
ncbi:hypothetical protein KMT30_49735, partial [Streptomyces sp. IBSBF 2953]|nr:hypothetical protein [Streptomyces hayashii]